MSKFDMITSLSECGLDHVVDDILDNLGISDVAAFQAVSKSWQELVNERFWNRSAPSRPGSLSKKSVKDSIFQEDQVDHPV